MSKELVKGVCQFVVIEDVSKAGKPYKRIKLIFGEYEKDFVGMVSDEMLFCIRKAGEKN